MENFKNTLFEYINEILASNSKKQSEFALYSGDQTIENTNNSLVYSTIDNNIEIKKEMRFLTLDEISDVKFLTKDLINNLISTNLSLVYVVEPTEFEIEQQKNAVNYDIVDKELYQQSSFAKVYILDEAMLVKVFLQNQSIESMLSNFYNCIESLNYLKFSHVNEFSNFWLKQVFLAHSENKFLTNSCDVNEYINWENELKDFVFENQKLIIEKNEHNWVSAFSISKNMDLFSNVKGIYKSSSSGHVQQIIRRNKELFGATEILRFWEHLNQYKTEYWYLKEYTKNLNSFMGDYFKPIQTQIPSIDLTQGLSSALVENQIQEIQKLDLVNKLKDLAIELKIPQKIAKSQIFIFEQFDLNNINLVLHRYNQVRESFRLIYEELNYLQPNLFGLYKYNVEISTFSYNHDVKEYIDMFDQLLQIELDANTLFINENKNKPANSLNELVLNSNINKSKQLSNVISLEDANQNLNKLLTLIKNSNIEQNDCIFKNQDFIDEVSKYTINQLLDVKVLKTLELYSLVEKHKAEFASRLLDLKIFNFVNVTKDHKDIVCVLLAIFEKSFYYFDK